MRFACTNWGKDTRSSSGALVGRLAWWLCNLNRWVRIDVSALDEAPTPSKIRPYLPVEDLPQNHQILLTADERSKIKNELIAARARQESRHESLAAGRGLRSRVSTFLTKALRLNAA